jgi:hypothetical protein
MYNMHQILDVKYWVGASDFGQQRGQFRWSDGRTVDGAFWDSGEPAPQNHTDAYTCTHLRSGKLRALPCYFLGYCVCEVEKKFSKCLH